LALFSGPQPGFIRTEDPITQVMGFFFSGEMFQSSSGLFFCLHHRHMAGAMDLKQVCLWKRGFDFARTVNRDELICVAVN
jgi:hypothetical protein